jgi:SAM-dependent methyltransferase
VDLSESVEVAQEIACARDNLHVVQADLLRLPFRRAFDLVYTLGVLHHLPDGEDGFTSLLRCVRPGGRVHVWVYGHEGNEWLLRWVDPVRRGFTSRLPPPLLKILAWLVAAPLHLALLALYRNAGRWPFRLPYAPYLTWLSRFPFRHTQQVVFDHLGAPIAHYYRREELAAWFERAGLHDVQITSRNGNSWRATAKVRT